MNSAETAFVEFIEAFNALDWQRFSQCFAPNASLFAPELHRSHSACLIDGGPAVQAHFQAVFASERSSGTGPSINPTNVRIQPLGLATCLVTFEFARAAGSVGRRTILFQNLPEGWKVVHVHASNTQPIQFDA
jgi:ketosteroid isomerase-like protein